MMIGGMQGHCGGDAAWHREERQRKMLEDAAYIRGAEDMKTRLLVWAGVVGLDVSEIKEKLES